MDEKLVFEALRRGLITPEMAKQKLSGGFDTAVKQNVAQAQTDEMPAYQRAFVGLGAGLTKAGVGAIQAGADLVGADKVSQAAGQVVTNIDKDINRLGGSGKVGAFVGEIGPYAALPAGGATMAGRAGMGALGGALAGAAKPVAEGEDYNRLKGAAIGGAVGAAIPAGLEGAAKGVKHALVPNIAPELQPLAQRAQQFGIPLSLSNISPTKIRNTAQKVSAAIPLSGVQKFEEAQRQAFNKAVASTLGETSDNLGPETIRTFLNKAEKGFGSVLGGKTITPHQDAVTALDMIAANAKDYVDDNVASIVQSSIKKFKGNIEKGVISGEKLASFRSELVKNMPKAKAEARGYLGELVEAIDDMIAPSLNESEKQALGQLRRQWRNFRTVEPLLEKSTDGNINPTDLMNRVASSPYIKAARSEVGTDDLVDLARIGKQFLKVPGGSDTFEKGLIGGSGLGTGYLGLTTPAALLDAGATAGSTVGLNRAYQKFINQNPALVRKALKAPNPMAKIKP